ncbi:MAG: hypothetical protein AB7E51_17930, partial [Pseudodesulfovibrio sp.]|uniref:hypothetical protein n=1 Tax=Pseudodesulfovibrio sp. TaxID=2035812 RepID=UPI003D125DB9
MLFGSEFCEFDGNRRELTIDLGGQCGIRYRLTGWGAGLEVLSDEGGGWRITSRLDEWAFHSADYAPSHPIAEYMSLFPPEAVNSCRGFDYYQCGMFRMLRQLPDLSDLIHRSPALAWLLPRRRIELGLSWEEFGRICRSPRKDILKALYGHGSKSLVKLLEALPLEGTRFEYNSILSVVQHQAIQAFLRHAPKSALLKAGYLERAQSILCHRWFRNAVLDEEVALSHEYVFHCVELADDTVKLGKSLGFADARLTVARSPDLARLFSLHERWMKKVNSREMEALACVDFG